MELLGHVFVKSHNGMKIMALDTDCHCLRMRQRSKVNGKSVKGFKFVSFKQMKKHKKRYPDSILPTVTFDTRPRL